jgi:hypothetical protein
MGYSKIDLPFSMNASSLICGVHLVIDASWWGRWGGGGGWRDGGRFSLSNVTWFNTLFCHLQGTCTFMMA